MSEALAVHSTNSLLYVAGYTVSANFPNKSRFAVARYDRTGVTLAYIMKAGLRIGKYAVVEGQAYLVVLGSGDSGVGSLNTVCLSRGLL